MWLSLVLAMGVRFSPLEINLLLLANVLELCVATNLFRCTIRDKMCGVSIVHAKLLESPSSMTFGLHVVAVRCSIGKHKQLGTYVLVE